MDHSERYRKELDIIFQELEERESLALDAKLLERANFIDKILSYKVVQDLLKKVPLESRIKIVDGFVAAKFPSSN